MPGPEAICQSPPPVDIEALLRRATGARPEASVVSPPIVERHDGPGHALEHAATDVAQHLVDHAVIASGGASSAGGLSGAAAGIGAFGAAAPPLGALVSLTHAWVQAWEEGDAQNVAHFSEVMRGALAHFEDRRNGLESRLEAQRSPGYAEGLRRAERLLRTDPALHDAIMDAALRSSNEGQSAVARGADRGPAFERRYEVDPSFRNGVDFLRRLRQRDPSAFEGRAERFRQMQRQLDACRPPVRG